MWIQVTSRETDQEVMVSADDEAVQGIPPLHNMTNPHGVDFEVTSLSTPTRNVTRALLDSVGTLQTI